MPFNYPQELCLISSQTASSSASISFTSGISSNFNTYLLSIRNFMPATNAIGIRLTFSTDGGSTYLNTNYKYSYLELQGGAYSAFNSTSAAFIQLISNQPNTSTKVTNIDITLYNLSNSLIKSTYQTVYTEWNSPAITETGFGCNTGTTAVNAIKIACSSGNISSGTFKLYGINE